MLQDRLVSRYQRPTSWHTKTGVELAQTKKRKPCMRCGGARHPARNQCPALWVACRKCRRIDHYVCLSKTAAAMTIVSEQVYQKIKGLKLDKPNRILHGPAQQALEVLGHRPQVSSCFPPAGRAQPPVQMKKRQQRSSAPPLNCTVPALLTSTAIPECLILFQTP